MLCIEGGVKASGTKKRINALQTRLYQLHGFENLQKIFAKFRNALSNLVSSRHPVKVLRLIIYASVSRGNVVNDLDDGQTGVAYDIPM